MNKKNKLKDLKVLAVSEALILIIGIIAFGYVLGSELKVVSAAEQPEYETYDSKGKATVVIPAIGGPAGGALLAAEKGATGANALKFNALFAAVLVVATLLLPEILGADANLLYDLGMSAAYPIAWAASELAAPSAVGAIGPQAVTGFFGKEVAFGLTGFGLVVLGVEIVVSIIWGLAKTEQEKVQYICSVWEPPLGGRDCERCNSQKGLPCTEYMCKSLGQSCELINQGTGEEACVWLRHDDVNPPIIKPWNNALLSSEYSYVDDRAISPPDKGVFVKYKGGCIPPFTKFQFGIILDEPAKCKIDPGRTTTFDEMNLYFGNSQTKKYNHTQRMILPSPESLAAENLTLENDGEFNLYVRCQDSNGNPKGDSPSMSFVFKYCVEPGPDTQAPVIRSTSISDNSAIAFNQSSVPIELYINEPAECRWTHDRNKGFDNMENNMTCPKSAFEMSAQLTYKCTTILTGLKDRETNVFYFKCKDKPFPGVAEEDRRTNAGYPLRLIGTQPLVIDSAKPEGTVKGSGSTVKVTLEAETSAGYKDGESICYYSESCFKEEGSKTNYGGNVVGIDERTFTHTHSEDIYVAPGTYECSIKCVDFGGNADTKNITYIAETDEAAPKIVRAFHEISTNQLMIITDEKASCVYSSATNLECKYSYEEGQKINKNSAGKEHSVPWNPDNTYYIKCQDDFTNQPFPDQCSIIVRPSEDFD